MRVAPLAVVLAACATEPPPPAPLSASAQRGGALAEQLCAVCHAVGRTGESTFESAPPFRRLSWNYPIADLEEALAEGVLVGHPAMPQFRLEPQEADDLLAYLSEIQEPAPAADRD
jgi:mono/diheme cytochrome c family protein